MDDYTVEAVYERLRELNPLLAESFVAAWKTWTTKGLAMLPGANARARRNVMHALIMNEVRARFQGIRGVKIVETRDGRFLLSINATKGLGQLLIRFKHLDEKYRTNNFQTPAARDYDRQRSLAGLPPALRITAGYQTDVAETDIAIFVVRAYGKDIIWWYELPKPGADVIQIPQPSLPFPQRPAVRVRAKRSSGEREASNKDGTKGGK